MSIQKSEFGKTQDSQPVTLYALTNKKGTVLKMMDYGAIVVALEYPDRAGHKQNITLGFDNLQSYLDGHPFFGATVGRFCNRIAEGEFTLDEQTYQLAKNNGPNHLHGGDRGFDKYVWDVEESIDDKGPGLVFTRRSKDGEEGYPGNLDVTALYRLGHDDSLTVEFVAKTDKATPINLTNHCYWNLAGTEDAKEQGSVYDHEVSIMADHYLEVDEGCIPQKIASVKGTPFDFLDAKKVGQDIAATPGGENNGYDHCYALNSQDGTLAKAARVFDPKSGRVMEIHTTQPGIQFYTGNFLDGTLGDIKRHGALCLETQHYPDAPNQANFPSAILRPGESFKQTTVHKFSIES